MDKRLRVLALMMAAMLVVFMIGCSVPIQLPSGVKEELEKVKADDEVAQFGAEGVVVVVPGRAGEVKVVKLPLGELKRKNRDEFTPERPVIDIKFVDANGNTLTAIVAELYVLYKREDVDNAGGKENLALGFWNGRQWIRFTEKHEFELRDMRAWSPEFLEPPDDAQGFAFVRISSWGDRAIAWGRLRF